MVIALTGELESPDIAFNIEFPGTNSIIQSELEYSLQDPTVEERNAIFLLAQGSFVNERTGINSQAVTGNLLQTGTSLLNQVGDTEFGAYDKIFAVVDFEDGNPTDGNGDPTNPLEGFDTFFTEAEYFTHLELGWAGGGE